MKRRNFFKDASLAFLGTTLLNSGTSLAAPITLNGVKGKKAKNIIFLVSDGMSNGTLTMADLFLQRKEGRNSEWVKLLNNKTVRRAMMDTASANSLVTDSAAGSSAWGGGVRVNNGSLNVNADGSFNKPILQKFKAIGKAVGCVTSVPITHATPAGFCVNNNKRGDMDEIADDYLKLRFDVMMGAGSEVFSADKRKDKKDLFNEFAINGFNVVRTRDEMLAIKEHSRPILGVFNPSSLPYALDRENDDSLKKLTPSLAEMSKVAITQLSKNPKGFVLQIEGGKVDWAAHANDAAALIYDQVAFDEALKVALDFAKSNKETLVIVTTDHGNSNPGLFYGKNANENFDRIQKFKHTNDWILMGITKSFTPEQVVDRIYEAQGYKIKLEEAKEILQHYEKLDEDGVYNSYKLPFRPLAVMQQKYLSVGWGAMDHSGDYVELSMFGPGSEMLQPFVKNYELHNFMLAAAGVKVAG